jgi:hypothetical protein
MILISNVSETEIKKKDRMVMKRIISAVKPSGKSVLLAVALVAVSASTFAATLSTSIELNNNTSSDNTLINGTNVSGIVTPAFPGPAIANSTSYHTSMTNGLADAGVLTYRSCRFNWSIIDIGSIYTFSIGATPSSKCSSEVLVQNVFTGEYSIKFNIND